MFNLLTESSTTTGGGADWLTWVVIIAMIAICVVMFVVSSRKNKKRQQEAQDLINAVKPGNKVKTIGGVCGIVVEVDLEENTFVLETGSEETGKTYVKFMREAIYQTDAVVEKKDPAITVEDAPAEKATEQVEEKTEEPEVKE